VRLVNTLSLKNPYFGEIPVNSPTTKDLRAVYALDNSKGVISMIVGGEEHNVYYTTNASASTATWTKLPIPTTIRKAGFIFDGANNYMLPALISDKGTLIRLSNTESTSPVNTLAIADSSNSGSSTSNFTDIGGSDTATVNDTLVTYNAPGATLTAGTYILTGRYPSSGFPAEIGESSVLSALPASNAVLTNLVYTGSNRVSAADSVNNKMYKGKIGSGSITWQDVSTNVHSNRISDLGVFPTGGTTVFSTGDKGRLYYSKIVTSGTVNMKALAMPTLKNLSGIISNATALYAVGDSSAIYKATYGLSGYALSTFTTILSPVGYTPLYGIANSGTKAYIAGANGTELFLSSPSATSAVQGVSGGVTNFNGVCSTPFGTAFLFGNNSNMWAYGATSGKKVDSLFDCRFWAENFMDVNHGFVVGDSGIIRRTDNGGALWQTVLPEINSNGVPDYKTVWTTGIGNSIVAGTGGFLGRASGSNIVTHAGTGSTYVYNSSSTQIWYKIKFHANYPNSGYVVGSGGSILQLAISGATLTVSNFAHTLPASSDLHAIHVFRDNSFIVAGAQGSIYYYNLAIPGWINCSPSTNTNYTNFTFNDIYFRDDIVGYVVGDSAVNLGGEIMKCTILQGQIQSLDPSLYTTAANPLGFAEMPVEDGLTAKSIVSNTGQVNYNTIAFTGPYDGFVGGSYSTSPPSNTQNYPYARLINDRGGEFSSLYWYDRLGRLVLSQNTKQNNEIKKGYTYILYDNNGRIYESGQKIENADTSNLFNKIFGDTIMGIYNPSVISPNKYITWIKDNTGLRIQVMHNYYDVQEILPTSVLQQQNLRNRIASITYRDTVRTDSLVFNNAIHYSYDIIGDVPTQIQDDSIAGIVGQRYKRLDYKYDFVSGEINELDYQSGQLDQYHQKYSFDADFRITNVSTSRDSILWDNDAHYFYYPHFHLARVEVGDQQVQGMDYVYTLQGQIKAMNSDILSPNNDIGSDGLQIESNLNKGFAKDAAGYSIDYFTGDYDPINKTKWNNIQTRFESVKYGSSLMNSCHNLFNGNISAMITTISKPVKYSNDTSIHINPLPQGTSYVYDQLNRIVRMRAYQNLGTNNTWGSMTYSGLYFDSLAYDANGNILFQQRNDSIGGIMSILNYHYNNNNGTGPTLQNRLYHVNNAASTPNPLDIKDEGAFNSASATINQKNNYRYTAMGELAKDTAGGIDTIIWNDYRKPWKIKKYNGDSIIFYYDASLNRIRKEYKPTSGYPVNTFYVHDGGGNIIAIYMETMTNNSVSYILKERDIYGANRIGVDNTPVQLISPVPIAQVDSFARYLGDKQYEIYNHLKNVIAVVSDRKIQRLNNKDSLVYEPDIISSNDYYPFGMLEPGRNFSSSNYRYAFNGKEKDDETYGEGDEYDYGNRLFDPRVGRFFSEDRVQRSFPELSTYQFASNNPIFAIDLDGKEATQTTYTDDDGFTYVCINVDIKVVNNSGKNGIDAQLTGIMNAIATEVEDDGTQYDPATCTLFITHVNIIPVQASQIDPKKDFYLEFVEDVSGTDGDGKGIVLGATDKLGATKVNRMQVLNFIGSENMVYMGNEDPIFHMIRTGVHEIFHALGLNHPGEKVNGKRRRKKFANYDFNGVYCDPKTNVMYQSRYGSGTDINIGQLNEIKNAIIKNEGANNVELNTSTPAQQNTQDQAQNNSGGSNNVEGGGQRDEETADHADAESMKGGVPDNDSGSSGGDGSAPFSGGGDESGGQSSSGDSTA